MQEPARKHEDQTRLEVENDNWWESDRTDAIGWALAFIWGALVLLAEGSEFTKDISWWDGWGVFFVGVGVITVTLALSRLATNYRTGKTGGGVIFGLILIGIGVGDMAPVWVWPLVLAVIGISILISALKKK